MKIKFRTSGEVNVKPDCDNMMQVVIKDIKREEVTKLVNNIIDEIPKGIELLLECVGVKYCKAYLRLTKDEPNENTR